jgi:predicted TIM-barrel fold metal-dependent hydrolase
MPVIDADAHVMEGPHTWEFCDPSEKQYMPIEMSPGPEARRHFWFIDGKIRGHVRHVIKRDEFEALAADTGRDMVVPAEAQHMQDVQARIADMDRTKVDVQVLYPTIFIQQVTTKPEWEVPICKAYNRWLADIWKRGGGRLRWVCVLPLLSMPDALDMLPWCKENGAVAVLMRPLEGDRTVPDPYFYPLYDKMSDLSMPIGMHIGIGNPEMVALMSQRPGFATGFSMTAMTAWACHDIIANKLPETFPKLRFGFIESAAQWVPWVIKDIRRHRGGNTLPENLFQDYRIFVSCYSSTDDIDYIAQYSGDDNLMTGTDYGHVDMSVEIDALRSLSESGRTRPDLVKKMLTDNPARFYGIE